MAEPSGSPISDSPIARGVRADEDPDAAPAVPEPELETLETGGAVFQLTADGLLPFDIWRDQFFMPVFVLPGAMLQLQTLQAVPENPATGPAAQAVYDIIRETPSLHFMARPGGVWLERVTAIGMFAFVLQKGVSAELRERRAAKVGAGKPAKDAAPELQPIDPPADAVPVGAGAMLDAA